ncbi:MAG TPA: phosphoserine transaminase [Geminicoccus sp.]|uniref:phosphoserine transaminase n=1 Tax=Geminicoccus sp. TaxID=2024832 RepID=UPI002E356B2F|nr:phosphoserine transaminase [Geminicoccus sp.]HEX2525681.1 phosphoserine transaminase [Geminicoccus sp.]
MKPIDRPQRPFFGSGPTAKRPGWSLSALEGAMLGRSHRDSVAKARINDVIVRSRKLLGIPDDYRLGILPASDTGAFEAAMWSMLGARGTDLLAWESFGKEWVTDATKQLKLKDVRTHGADYGALPDLGAVDFARDVVFTWNGTTSGVRVPDGTWIADDREGLTLCDATSAVFAMDLPWSKLDVATWSWQKVLGGEAQHGMLALSPRAVARLESYQPSWPLPKIFRLTKGGKLIEGIFKGETINTPSMLAVEDALDGLTWAEQVGGLKGLIARSEANLEAIAGWVEETAWVDFLAADPATRSCTSICLKIADLTVASFTDEDQQKFVKDMASLLAKEKVAFDIAGYRDAPPGLRIWGGATVDVEDMRALLPWLTWAFTEIRSRVDVDAS